jgi:hypothetical protein
MKSFKQFNEEKERHIVFTFGRFNPPTTGHGKLLAKVASLAFGNDYRIYASQSSDSKKNPLQYKEKIKVMRKMFPKHGRNIVEDKNAKTALHIASILFEQGFTKITMVVGSDRVKEFKKLLNQYNGSKGRHGYYNFKDGIQIASAGERDPDAEGVTGMSASKMRQAAVDGDFKLFTTGLPKAYGEDMTLFNLIRKRMGLKEMTNFRKHIQLPSISEKREQYILGEIFNEGDKAYTENNVEIIIAERKSNFIIAEDGNKYFVEKLNKTYGKGLSKSTKDKRQAQFNKQAKMADDDPRAYKPAPGDVRAKTKLSKHTIAYRKKFGEYVEKEDLEFGTKKTTKKYKKDTPGELEELKEPYVVFHKKTKEVLATGSNSRSLFARRGSYARGNNVDVKDLEFKKVSKKQTVGTTLKEGEGKSEPWEDGFKRRVVKTTKPEHLEKGFKWRIKGKDRDEISIKLYKKKPDFEEFKKQMKRVAGHEFGG